MTEEELLQGYKLWKENKLNDLGPDYALQLGMGLGEAMKKDKDIIKKFEEILNGNETLKRNKEDLDIMKSSDRLLEI